MNIFVSLSLTGQIWEEELRKTNHQPSVNERFEAFENYRLTNPYIKGNGFKPYARQLDFILERSFENNVFKKMRFISSGLKKKKVSQIKKSVSLQTGFLKGPLILPLFSLMERKEAMAGLTVCI